MNKGTSDIDISLVSNSIDETDKAIVAVAYFLLIRNKLH